MPANAFIRTVALSGLDWRPLAGASTVVQATVIASPKNVGNVSMRYRQGTPAEWPPGAAVPLESVDLSELEALGASGDTVLIASFAPGQRPHGSTREGVGFVKALSWAASYMGGGGGVTIPGEGGEEIGGSGSLGGG